MFEFAKTILIILLIALFLFHILILLQILPYTMVWGSRLKSKKEMLRFESISLVVTGIFIWLAMEATGDIGGSNSVILVGMDPMGSGLLFWIEYPGKSII